MSRYDTIGKDDMNHVAHGVYIGSHYVLKSSHYLLSKGIRNVVNAAIEFITETPELVNWEDLHRSDIEVHNTYWDDTLAEVIYPTQSIDQGVQKIDEVVRSGMPILVNCAMGKSRSTSLVIAYLMARHGHDYDTALTMCKRARPICQPNANFERQLRSLDMALRATRNQYTPPPPQEAPYSPRYSYDQSGACEPPRPYNQPPAIQAPPYGQAPQQQGYTPYSPQQQPAVPNYYNYPNAPQGRNDAYQPSSHPYSPLRSVSPPPQKNYYDNYNSYLKNNHYQPNHSQNHQNHNNYFNNHHYYNNQCFNNKRRLSL